MLSIFAIRGLTYTLGKMTGSTRHGWRFGARWRSVRRSVTTPTGLSHKATPAQGVDQRSSIPKRVATWRQGVRLALPIRLFATIHGCQLWRVNAMHDRSRARGMCHGQHHAERTVFGGGCRHVRHSDLRVCRLYRRTDGGPYTRISGKEDEAFDIKMAMLTTWCSPSPSSSYGDLGLKGFGPRILNPGRRLLRNSLCVRFHGREQWVGVRRFDRQYPWYNMTLV